MRDNDFNQMNLFNFNRPYKHIDKTVRVIELFSGIGAQAKALKILGVDFIHYKTCEWAAPSIKAYNAIHLKDWTDYSKGKTKEELIQFLDGNISTNYNEPCDVKKKPESWLRETYNNCIATHNLMNIMKVKGKDLEIVDTDKYEYIMTYSFPCQDLSLAGNKKGMSVSQADGGTRSGLLWEVERILGELTKKPQILIMENVPEVIGVRNIKDFQKWEAKLSSLGYTNFVDILNAKNYGIPQNRRRCFMISILGDYSYDFPQKRELKYRLKDLLEKEVDEKFYLTSQQTLRISNWKAQQKPLDNVKKNVEVSPTITARGAGEDHSGMILVDENLFKNNEIVDCDNSDAFLRNHNNQIAPTLVAHSKFGVVKKVGNYGNGHHAKDIYDPSGVAPTITTGNHGLGQTITEENLKSKMCEELISTGKVKENDVIRHSYTNSRISGEMKDIQQNNISPTLDTRCDCLGVVVKNATKQGYLVAEEGDGIDISTRMESHRGTVQKGIAQTITTMGGENVGVVVKEKNDEE